MPFHFQIVTKSTRNKSVAFIVHLCMPFKVIFLYAIHSESHNRVAGPMQQDLYKWQTWIQPYRMCDSINLLLLFSVCCVDESKTKKFSQIHQSQRVSSMIYDGQSKELFMSVQNSMALLFILKRIEWLGVILCLLFFEFYYCLLHSLYNRILRIACCLFHFHLRREKKKSHRPLILKMKCSFKFIDQLLGYSQFESNVF